MHTGFWIAFATFIVAFGGLWLYRRLQLSALREQTVWIHVFSEEVQKFRAGDAPPHAKDLVERLAQLPPDPKLARRVAIRIIRERAKPGASEPGKYLETLRSLPPAEAASFASVVIAFFIAVTAGDWLLGGIVRKMRLGGLDQETQAEVAIETVAAYGYT